MEEKAYNGFWKQMGCVLSILAILGIATILITGVYLLFKGL